MNNKTRILSALYIVATLLLAWPSMAVAQPTDAVFQQALAAYQQSPSADTFEKVIKMAATMDQLPPIPSEAQRRFVRGATLFKDAQTPDDFKQASDEFSQAVRLAPWWSEALFNLAMAHGAACDYAQAIADLKSYQLFKLSKSEADATQNKIWEFETKQEKAAKDKEMAAERVARARELAEAKARESSPGVVAAREQEQFLRRINGAQYRWVLDDKNNWTIEVRDGAPIFKQFGKDYYGSWYDAGNKQLRGQITFELKGKTLQGFLNGIACPTLTGAISEDGGTITMHDGRDVEIFNRVR